MGIFFRWLGYPTKKPPLAYKYLGISFFFKHTSEVIFKFPYYDVDKNGTIEHDEFLKQLKNIDDWFGDNFVLMKQKFAATDFNGDGALRHFRKFQNIETSQISKFFIEIFNQVSRLEFEAFQFPRFDKRVQFLFHKEMFLAFDKDLSGEITFDELAYQVSLNPNQNFENMLIFRVTMLSL